MKLSSLRRNPFASNEFARPLWRRRPRLASISLRGFLVDSGCNLWQVLPLGPTGYGDSPYQCFSAFAGNPYLISPDFLLNDGLLTEF